MTIHCRAFAGDGKPHAGSTDLHHRMYDPADTIKYSGSTSFCQGSNLVLTANNAPSGASFQWQKNSADIPGATSINYTATASGSYTVIVTSNGVPVTYAPVVITVYPYPVAGFNFSPNSQCSNVPVQFTNTSSGSGVSYSWNFGDPNSGGNNTSTAVNPLHHFIGTPGNTTQNFTVTLVASIGGCTNTFTQTVTTTQVPGTELGGTGLTIYNGLPYFTQCASVTSTFTFTNQSSTTASNTGYVIKWGDSNPDFTAASWSSTTHTYNIGTYQLQLIVTGQNGCKDTGTYYVFVGNNPAVGLNNPGNTFICSGTSLTFPISGTTNNPPGTTYTVSFNDNSLPITFSHPAPPDVTHTFIIGSCGTNSGSFANSFQATIQASNPCGTSAASVVPIYVSQKGTALFSIQPKDTVCVTNTVTFTNTSSNSYGVSSSGTCTPGKGVWQISPATGWTVTSGNLGNDFGLSDPATWTNGSTILNVNFNTPGVYTIKLEIGANTLCGTDFVIKTICVNPAPVAAFTLDNNQGCAPAVVTATNHSNAPNCGNNTYQWSVSYSNTSGCAPAVSSYNYINGTSATSTDPQFQFNNPGVYTISLVTKSPGGTCTSTATSQTVTVKAKPTAAITAPAAVCQNNSINPSATVNSCYASTPVTYSWSFPGGTPASSNAANPGPIQYTSSGTYTINLTVTNECGSVTVTKNINVNPAPDVNVPANQTVCAGTATGGFSFTGSVTGTVFNWTNSNTAIGLAVSGSGAIPVFTAANSGSTPLVATIIVTPSSGCAGVPQAFTITVNPRPAAPVVSTPVLYCLNETASPLTATATGSNVLTWYNNVALTNGSAIAPTPATGVAGTVNYYVTQTNSFSCPGPSAVIAVTVFPALSGNVVGNSQAICTAAQPTPFTSQATISGGNGSYNYQWQVSTDNGVTWTNIAGATGAGYAPAVLSADTKYRRVVTSSNCSDTSNIISIAVQGSLANYDIAQPQTICSGTAPALLTGQTPSGGNSSFTYQWESSPNNIAWTPIGGATAIDYQPPVLTATTYYRRKTGSGSCSGYSSSIAITVNPKPVITPVANALYCNGATVPVINFNSTPNTNVTYGWTNDNTAIGLAASGSGNLPSFIAGNSNIPKQPITAHISVTPTYTANSISCAGNPLDLSITVLPAITLNAITNEVVCTGVPIAGFTPVHDAAAFTGSSVSFRWTVNGGGITLANGNGGSIPSYNTINSGSTDLVATITVTPVYSYNGKTCDGTPVSYTVTVKPGTPPAHAGNDTILCAATSYTLQATLPSSTAGVWTQFGTATATITNPSQPNTTVTGLQPNVYHFVWTLSGFASCPDSKDTVTVTVDPPLSNTVNTTPLTICAGQAVTVTGNAPSGGNGTYFYQWQQSTDGVNWTDISGQTSGSITFAPAQTVFLRRFVRSLPCSGMSDTAQVIVQPALSNNVITADQSVCIHTVPVALGGSVPAGGNGVFNYQWQQSTDGGATWTNIIGANSVSFAPGALTVTTQYRRNVGTSLCSGPQASSSNTVTITVRPDAQALFLPTDTLGCIPFQLTPALINLQSFPAQNSQYVWYVNNVFLGNGTFPGYTMTAEDDTITVKLVAVSRYGCLNDSISHRFYTYKLPHPSYTVSDTVGCGPLTIQLNNTTPDISLFHYQWNFGNGQSSTLPQPGNITFLPAPTHNDTTYVIRLTVASPCDTLVVSRSIRVKAKPRAFFTPNNSVGCSPMTVVFNNTSLGNGNTYTWNFGDGSAPVSTTAAGPISHVFTTGVTDTFHVRLIAVNECGSDTLTYAVVVRPNTIYLDFAVNGNEQSGCAPHTVHFINNSNGASGFTWNFDDGNIINTVRNIDTVTHTFQAPGTYVVQLHATNGCSDTTSTETIVVYPKPHAAFTASIYTACLGDSVRFSNLSTGATSYLWDFGDGRTATVAEPIHVYGAPGTYPVILTTIRLNTPGSVCSDTVMHPVQVVASMPGWFTASDTVSFCAPFTATFANQNLPSLTATWDFGDGQQGSGNTVTHTFAQAGIYLVKLITVVPGGCTYITTRTVKVLGPSGSWTHTSGYLCNGQAASFQVLAANADNFIFNFGDGNTLTTTDNLVYHTYSQPGVYLPSVILKNNGGCQVVLRGIDSIRVEQLHGGFTAQQQKACGQTSVSFSDTTHSFFGINSVDWDFGDGHAGTGATVTHLYFASGTYTVQQVITGRSGCRETITRAITVSVNARPVAAIIADTVACAGFPVSFASNIQSGDPINIVQWNLSNGVSSTSPLFTYSFTQAGIYTVRLIAGTVNSCYDTATKTITIRPSPTVTASNDLDLCRGNSATLSVSGTNVVQYQWSPLQGLSCNTCTNPVASPLVTTPYVVKGLNSFGCPAYDTVVVTVIQPLHLSVPPADSICIGSSTTLVASGASIYNWSPAAGLNSTVISNPVASPTVTTRYRVVGYDGYHCFTDTAFVLVAVGAYPVVSLGPDLTLATGTLHPMISNVTNGPVRSWLWTPSTDLSCNTCALPVAHIKRDISYSVQVTTAYGCSASDTVSIKVFCLDAQVFIPNAFTPDGDGFNDVLMVRATGVALVRSFRVFNRWGDLVFEKGNCPPNDPAYGWDGKVKGVASAPGVYVYTAEVVCENGAVYPYKGNVTILK